MQVLLVAEQLGKFAWEVLDEMSLEEFRWWLGLAKIRADQRKKDEARMKAQQALQRGGSRARGRRR